MMSLKLTTVALFALFAVVSAPKAGALELKDVTPKYTVLGAKVEDKPLLAKKDESPKSEPVKVETPKVITYTVAQGDTLTSIAEKNKLDLQRIWDKNTQLQNQNILEVGQVLTLPNADEVLSDRPFVAPPEPVQGPSETQTVTNTQSVPQARTEAPRASQAYVGGPNAYGWGQCTWYVKNRKPQIGSYWGNAGYSWLSSAQAAGFSTGSTPVAGAIGVESGHVVIVESVNGDGTINLSEMNYAGGVGVVHYDTRSASEFFGFIYA